MDTGPAIVLMFVLIILSMVIGLRVGFVFAMAILVLFAILWENPYFLLPASFDMMKAFTLLAMPCYMMLGMMVDAGGLAGRLLEWLAALLGRGKRVFGSVNIAFCTVFGAISGSAMSAIAAIGGIMAPKAEGEGYPREYIVAVIACSSLISMLIPPSMTMIVFGVTTELSIPRLFLAGAIPGLLVTALYLFINFVMTRNFPSVAPPPLTPRARIKELAKKTKSGATVLALPIIILGGIYGGVFTPTEAAAVAVVWIILDGFILHREFIPKFKSSLLEAGVVIGAVACILFFIFMLSRVMIWYRVPQILTELVTSTISSKVTFLLTVNILILFLGMIMNEIACIIIAAIMILPMAVTGYGIDPYHFGAILCINAGMANLTPPVAANLYFAAGVGDVPVVIFPPSKYLKTVLTYLVLGHLPVLAMTTYIPSISLVLINLWGK